jgi:hypothetical protein
MDTSLGIGDAVSPWTSTSSSEPAVILDVYSARGSQGGSLWYFSTDCELSLRLSGMWVEVDNRGGPGAKKWNFRRLTITFRTRGSSFVLNIPFRAETGPQMDLKGEHVIAFE